MHPDVIEEEKGTCPLCKMDLVATRLETVWTCPVHAVVKRDASGECPLCRRALVRQLMVLSWTCERHPEIDQSEPAACPDGSPMIAKRSERAHGNHNPQHGGVFFMAPDNWHHLEGAYPEAGVFRLYLYDDYTRPLPADQIERASGRIVTDEAFDDETRSTRELKSFALRKSPEGPYLEARIDPLPLPSQVAAKLTLAPGGPEYRFDFAFEEFSTDRIVGTSSTSAAVEQWNAGRLVEIPSKAEDVLSMLVQRKAALKDAIARGALADLWLPALQAKDLALALEIFAGEWPQANRDQVSQAVNRLVRTAWLLDAYGDMGDREQIAKVYEAFAGAAAEIEAAFPTP
jgi:hypothetical protein